VREIERSEERERKVREGERERGKECESVYVRVYVRESV
jgi:hypothetical protein